MGKHKKCHKEKVKERPKSKSGCRWYFGPLEVDSLNKSALFQVGTIDLNGSTNPSTNSI